MNYRLLEEGDTIQIGDEILLEDCQSWDSTYYESKEAMGKHFIGKSFNPRFFVPTRRRVSVGGDG